MANILAPPIVKAIRYSLRPTPQKSKNMPQPASTSVSNLVQFTRRMLEGMQTRQSAPPLDEMRSALIEQVIDCDPKQTRHVRLGVKTARSVQQRRRLVSHFLTRSRRRLQASSR